MACKPKLILVHLVPRKVLLNLCYYRYLTVKQFDCKLNFIHDLQLKTIQARQTLELIKEQFTFSKMIKNLVNPIDIV